MPGSRRVVTHTVEIRPLRNGAPQRAPNVNNNVTTGNGGRNPQPPMANPLGIFNNIRVRGEVPAEGSPAANGSNVPPTAPAAGSNGRELEFVMDVTPEGKQRQRQLPVGC